MSVTGGAQRYGCGSSGAAGHGSALFPVEPIGLALCCFVLANGLLVVWLLAWGHHFLPQAVSLDIWNASILRADNSKHLIDPYSFLHLVFGMGLFLFVDRLRPGWPLAWKLIAAICGSALWEAVENTPYVILLFSDPSDPGAYTGDSIVNALSDMIFVVVGFGFAVFAGLWPVVGLALVIEGALALTMHDGLVIGTLHILGLT